MPPNLNPMHFLNPIPFLFFFFFFSISLADPRITEAGIYCGNSSSSSNRFSISSFLEELQILADHIKCDNNWGSHIFNLDPNIYALAQCMDDLKREECSLCFKKICHELHKCFPADSARIYLDGCFLRYDNYSFFREAISQKYDKVVCNLPASHAAREDYMGIEFAEKVHEAITNVTETAVSNKQFAVAEVKGGAFSVYALAQCWESVSEVGCKACLEKAGGELRQCLPGKEGRALNTGCYLRYSTKKFYNDRPNNGGGEVLVVLLIAVVSTAVSLLALLGACVGFSKMSEKRGHGNVIHLSSAITNSNLSFKYEVLEKATDSFSSDRKLGEGGSGAVFKGNLADGRTVAVKRLCFNTRQWVDEFFNEVNLVSGIQHKNLIKLLGCSIEGPESLLVYEYLSNASLNQILFDRKKSQILSWRQRFDIITGVAEGLAHLHGGVPIRIIHRDIKCSNILLDENLTPKIADFGLIRGFASDKTHLSTGIAGTLGYMAPEYLVRGQLTEKADVYSFGVLVIETVCGRKNNAFIDDSILHTVWNHYQSNSLQECVDACLKQDFPMEEVSKVLQVGLLCTQASVTLRPFMPEVIQMLTNYDYDVPAPKQPPFLTSSVMNSGGRVPHTHISITDISTDTNPTFYSISTSASFWNTETQESQKT